MKNLLALAAPLTLAAVSGWTFTFLFSFDVLQ